MRGSGAGVPRGLAAGLLVVALGASTPADAGYEGNEAGFSEIGEQLGQRKTERWVDWSGSLRVRGGLFGNLDLDRGTTPSGETLFPVSLSDRDRQVLTHADMRFRTDLAFYPPFGGVAAKVRLDVLDNVHLGSTPKGPPTAATGQSPPAGAIEVERAWAEALLPFGVLAAGRMGSHWGLGMLTHGGDCFECDSGDAADRIALTTPLFGHLWSFAFDLTAIGPSTPRRDGKSPIDIDPVDNVRTVTFAVLDYTSDEARQRRRDAGRTTVDYGAYVAHRWQDRDVPAHYVPTAQPVPLDEKQVVARDFHATAVDGWLRITHPGFRIEGEAAMLFGRWGQASLVPGVSLHGDVKARQWGFAVESDFGEPEAAWGGGLDLGAASGDPAFGFGVDQQLGDRPASRGDLDGPQAVPPHDRSFDNFRFHPDYHVDEILFREILGTVTDAAYVRPHGSWRVHDFGAGELVVELAMIASMALQPTSTPGQARGLGVEVDPSVSYRSEGGFRVEIDYAALFPLAGLDNPMDGLSARPAQLARVRLGYFF